MQAKIIFFGSSDFSAEILKALIQKFQIDLIITRADKPTGRKQILTKTAVSILAEKIGLEILKPLNLKEPALFDKIKSLSPDLFVVMAYGKIIPESLLSLPKHGAINIHPSILPKYRGPSPIKTALLNGDTETGVSIMLMDPEMDHGPILQAASVTIDQNETEPELSKKLIELSKRLILEVIPEFLEGKIKIIPQDHSKTTYTKIFTKEDGKINWNRSAIQIYNQYRAFYVWPGSWTTFNDKILKILECRPVEISTKLAPGLVFETPDKQIIIGCSEGALKALKIQLAGKTPMAVKEFINGNKNFIGSVLV